MRSVIVCEGSTDFALIQYFMRTAYLWQDCSEDKILQHNSKFNIARTLEKNNNYLTIAGVGGCQNIISRVSFLLKRNCKSPDSKDAFQKMVIVIDRDEIDTEEKFTKQLQDCFDSYDIERQADIKHNEWQKCHYVNSRKEKIEMLFLVLIIPFEETGALETFLLNAVSKKDSYDAQIISECNTFVERIDPQKKYLHQRRYITKAKFDVYFSIRTPLGQFVERQDILKNVPWEDYAEIQTSFKKLKELEVNEES